MRTLDGLAYDFQQVGEYVYLTDDENFTVQARLAPYGTSSSAAVNIAAAANVNGDRVAYYVGANQPLLINGASAAVPAAGLTLPHGGTLKRSTTGYLITWPVTGEQLRLEPWGTFLNITISVPDRTQTYHGLLGTWDGNPNNDLVARTGQTFTSAISEADLYGAFGDSWRITQAESLFDYAAGQNTTTFTDDAFPTHPLTAATLPTEQFNQAHAACTAAGVVGTAELEDCVLDVAATAAVDPTATATVAQAAATTTLPPPLVVVKPWGYSQNFEMLDDGRWTPTNVREMPELDALESTLVLGPFASGEAVAFTLGALPQHTSITVAFDTQIVGPWNGDQFIVTGDSNGISVTTTFSNLLASQSFPNPIGSITHPAQTGALAVGSVDLGEGSTPRAVYHHSYGFTHSAAGIQLTFHAPNLPAGASWTLDNVQIITSNVGDPWNPKCTSNGSPLDDHNSCTIDSCDPSMGVIHAPRPAGTSCSDGNLCNGEESCNAFGSCIGIAPQVDDNNPCTTDVCHPLLGVTHTVRPVGSSCSDGVFCNGAETCNASAQCQPGTPPNPATLPPDTSCNGADDDCNGVPDEDYVPTTSNCGVGACATTGQLVCDHGSLRNTCTPLFAAAHDSLCDGIDDNCNGQIDEEYVGMCLGSSGVTVCTSGGIGSVSCDDDDPCTIDGCSTGACTHMSMCDDGNPCTADSCDPVQGCAHVITTGASCSDGNACTSGDTCTALGMCQGATFSVDDNNVCTDDACSPTTGVTHIPVAGRSCTDNNACTTGETCNMAGQCQGGSAVTCSDGQFCNGLETCSPATGCVPGVAPNTDDQVVCTVDSCNEATDTIVHQPEDSVCSDANACTGAEHCDVALGCVNGDSPNQDDDNPCTVDVCDPVQGVTHSVVAEGTTCGAGLVCNAAAQCREGYAFANFASLTPFQLNGAAVSINATPVVFNGQTVLRLTNNLNQSTTVMMKSPVNLRVGGVERSFSVHLVYQMTRPQGSSDQDGQGADGLTFIIANSPTVTGQFGAGIGYAGIVPSVIVEFDTWNNGSGDGNSGNQVGFNLNGNPNSTNLAVVTPRMNDGQVWHAWIDYDAATHVLQLRTVPSATRPTAATLSATVNIRSLIGTDSGFIGFTSGTGSAGNDHDIRSLVWTTF